MMEFLIFLTNKEYDQGTLDDHLAYLAKWSGTPDCVTTTKDLADATDEAKRIADAGNSASVVMDGNYEIFMTVEPQASKNSMIINLTSTPASQPQQALGVKDTVYLEWVKEKLSFTTLYQAQSEVSDRANALADLADESGAFAAMIDGPSFFVPTLVEALKARRIQPMFYVSEANDLSDSVADEASGERGRRLYMNGFVEA